MGDEAVRNKLTADRAGDLLQVSFCTALGFEPHGEPVGAHGRGGPGASPFRRPGGCAQQTLVSNG
jgi:hypothetical protein